MQDIEISYNVIDCVISIIILLPRMAGGAVIHVWGHNFPEALGDSQYKCQFGSDVVNATREAWNHVTCQAPQHVAGDVILEVSPDGVEYTNNDVSICQSMNHIVKMYNHVHDCT